MMDARIKSGHDEFAVVASQRSIGAAPGWHGSVRASH